MKHVQADAAIDYRKGRNPKGNKLKQVLTNKAFNIRAYWRMKEKVNKKQRQGVFQKRFEVYMARRAKSQKSKEK